MDFLFQMHLPLLDCLSPLKVRIFDFTFLISFISLLPEIASFFFHEQGPVGTVSSADFLFHFQIAHSNLVRLDNHASDSAFDFWTLELW
jgi:hypothetical protein